MRKPRQINGTNLPAFNEAFKDFNFRALGKDAAEKIRWNYNEFVPDAIEDARGKCKFVVVWSTDDELQADPPNRMTSYDEIGEIGTYATEREIAEDMHYHYSVRDFLVPLFALRLVGKTWKAAVIRSRAQFKVRIIKI